MIVMWEAESQKIKTNATESDHAHLVYAAIACALEVLKMLKEQPVTNGIRLGMHVGMGISTVAGCHVGGILNRWEFYITGPANEQMARAEQDAHEGELVISSDCYHTLMNDKTHAHQLDAVMLDSGNYHVQSLTMPPGAKAKGLFTHPPLGLCPEMIPFIKSYVPGCISISAAKGKVMVNGMRSITAIFIKFAGILEITDPVKQLAEVHRCFCAVQDAAYRVHGRLSKSR